MGKIDFDQIKLIKFVMTKVCDLYITTSCNGGQCIRSLVGIDGPHLQHCMIPLIPCVWNLYILPLYVSLLQVLVLDPGHITREWHAKLMRMAWWTPQDLCLPPWSAKPGCYNCQRLGPASDTVCLCMAEPYEMSRTPGNTWKPANGIIQLSKTHNDLRSLAKLIERPPISVTCEHFNSPCSVCSVYVYLGLKLESATLGCNFSSLLEDPWTGHLIPKLLWTEVFARHLKSNF